MNLKKLQKFVTKSSNLTKVVYIYRERIDNHPIRGIILEASNDYLVLQNLNDGIELDGYSIVFLKDITSICLTPNNAFYKRVLKKRNARLGKVKKVGTLSKALIDFKKQFKLLTFHRERISRTTCIVGLIDEVTSETINFKSITPSGVQSKSTTTLSFKDITKIDAGGKYEEALLIGMKT